MDFEFFEQLSNEEAQAFLDEYLLSGARSIPGMAQRLSGQGLDLDYTVASIRPVFEKAAAAMATVPAESAPPTPDWIATAGNIELDADSRILALHLSYYLGETFIRNGFGSLHWATGSIHTAVQNQPVVSGFKHRMEMAPVLVTENLLLRLLCNDEDAPASIDVAMSKWQGWIDAG